MRLRDLGGLVVIDFIDMSSNRHQRDVENKLQHALRFDRARVQLGRISKFGLLEMSRQRLRPSLGESSQLICPRCEGHGRMRSIESLSLSILRVAEEHAMKENTGQVLVQVPVEIANYLLNEKRRALCEIEQRHDAPIVIVADDQLETPHYEVTRIRENELGEESSRPSYQRGTPRKLATIALTKANLNVPAAPAVTNVKPAQPAPIREPREETPVATQVQAKTAAPTHSVGMVERILRFFRGAQATPASQATPSRTQEPRGRNDRNAQRRDGRKPGARNEQRRDEPRGNRPSQGAQPPRQQEAKPRNEAQQKQQKPKQSEPRGENRPVAQAQSQQPSPRTEDTRTPRPPRQPRPEPGVAVEARQPVAEASNPPSPVAIAVASLPEAPIATTTVAGNEAPAMDNDNAQAAAGESSSRRRRGRRGGRRRRRGGPEGANGADGAVHEQDEMLAGDVSAANRSQPEFDFDDDEIAEPTPSRQPMVAETAPVSTAPVAALPPAVEPPVVEPHAAEPHDVASPIAAPAASESMAQEPPATQSVGVYTETTASPVEPVGQAAFSLEPAIIAPADVAVVGLPETADAAREPEASPGLFDTAQVGSVASEDPAEAAANAVVEGSDAETVHGDNERSA
jgi:ribonuclease E